MAHRLLRDTEADGWERSDFPIICESCLGENPYVRMTKANFDKECKICTRPFTVFRWRPGRDARYKKTEVCQTCSKLKNVCQVCLLDLEYGLPVQVRDTALGIDTTDAIPKSDVNREYFAEEQDRKARAGLDYDSEFGKAKPSDTILRLQRTTPYYKRNRAHICSFYVRGECTRGAECPYRHEMPLTGELSQQNIKDRYYGVNDPVANKLLRRAAEMPSLSPPDDDSIKTLYVGGLDDRISEQDLKDQFYGYGEIESIRIVQTRSCAFIAYTTREGAEKAADNLANKLVIKGLRLKLMWGRPPAPRPESQEAIKGAEGAAFSAASLGLLPRQVTSQGGGPSGGGVPGGGGGGGNVLSGTGPQMSLSSYYPSMDPERMGAVTRPDPSEEGTAMGGEGEDVNRGAGSQQMHGYQNQQRQLGPPGISGGGGGPPLPSGSSHHMQYNTGHHQAYGQPPPGAPYHHQVPHFQGPPPLFPGAVPMMQPGMSGRPPPPPTGPPPQYAQPSRSGPPPPPPPFFRGAYRG